jgi:hypothetical protein
MVQFGGGRNLVDREQGTGIGMKDDKEINIPEILKDRARVQKALREGVQKALRMHKLSRVPAVVWEDGKVVEIPPEEIQLDDEVNGQAKKPER